MSAKEPNSSDHYVFLGDAGFPLGLAAIQRITLMGKALLNEGCRVTVLCHKGVWKPERNVDFGPVGNYEGIDYIYTSGNVFRPKGFLKRNLQKIKGMVLEFTYLRRLKKKEGMKAAILSTMSTFHSLRYRLYSILLGFPIAINLVEMASSIDNRGSFPKRLNDAIFDRWVLTLFQGAMPISDKLVDYYRSMVPAKPCMKVPVVCDFDIFDRQERNPGEAYFLYCGSAGFMPVIRFILESYARVSSFDSARLYMIISGGSQSKMEQLRKEISKKFKPGHILIFSNIPYAQLVELYTNALALLIPLRPTLQDTARFPHKTGEYLASGNPVITTNVGEIKKYLEDGKTALIADSYAVDQFADKMNFALENPEIIEEIGQSGRALGLREFHYKAHGSRMLDFLRNL